MVKRQMAGAIVGRGVQVCGWVDVDLPAVQFNGWAPRRGPMRPRVLVTDRENRQCIGKRRRGRKPRRWRDA